VRNLLVVRPGWRSDVRGRFAVFNGPDAGKVFAAEALELVNVVLAEHVGVDGEHPPELVKQGRHEFFAPLGNGVPEQGVGCAPSLFVLT
jgi:hypothetical protein